MRALWLVCILLSGGCVAPPRGVSLEACASEGRAGGANLALGPGPQYVEVARQMNYRSDWPAADIGLWFDDVSQYVDVQFDEQYFYNRFGSFYRTAESVRSAVAVR